MKDFSKYFVYKEDSFVNGLTKELISIYILNYYKKNNKDLLILCDNLYNANSLFKLMSPINKNVLLFPMDDFVTSIALAASPDLKIKRLETINELIKKDRDSKIIITSLMGYLKYLPKPSTDFSFVLRKDNKKLTRDSIIKKINEYGYRRESIVTTTGEYALRGFIIDIFPIDTDHPIRIEFFDNEIEEIRLFDENSQLMINNVSSIEIKRVDENIDSKQGKYSIFDYMNSKILFMINENQIQNSYKLLQQEITDYNISKNPNNFDYMFAFHEIKPNKTFKINELNLSDSDNDVNYHSQRIINFNSNFSELKKYVKKHYKERTIIFVVNTDFQKEKLLEIFPNIIITNVNKIIPYELNLIFGELRNGFIFEDFIVICPNDIEVVKNEKINYRNNIKIGRKIKSYNDLKVGDYIVHENHGIGVYNGLKTLKNGNTVNDYLQLLYSNNDKIYVPIDNIDKIYKYNFSEGKKPTLDKLNGVSWAKRKNQARQKIKDLSDELIKLYSKRKSETITPFKDFDDEFKFALSFPYTLTEDQEKSINEVNADLRSSIPMERLLCGDVGFGKTEVAFRAIFKTIINGFQAAYLCPTTILSKQQFESALARFNEFPINIELINRFTPQKKVKEIIEKLANGKIDLIIGTHKLLNSKIKYKKLGLLIIDEEQRFGVSHKEKIKKIKTSVNVLTMSATPIPRTLKMALSGIRSLSVIDTPPVNRYPIQTYVVEENDLIIKEAIYKELSRNGQTFLLVNNINNIESIINKVNVIVPEAKVIGAHGQMASKDLTYVMNSFIEHKYDVLVCTTIIETGIDISNANTILIIDADNFGLSQLYQIRGRVGRSNRISYCYLFYNPRKILSETAVKRLNSIKEFTELGSGYKIALRDLSIRGAGNLLGSEQAGFIASVGIELYTKMINEEINKETPETEDDTINLNISKHITDTYVEDEDIKIEIHKLINSIKSENDLDKIENEISDRFGKVDDNIKNYIFDKYAEAIIKNLNIKIMNKNLNLVSLVLPDDITEHIDGNDLFTKLYNINEKIKVRYINKNIIIDFDTERLNNHYVNSLIKTLEYIKSIKK